MLAALAVVVGWVVGSVWFFSTALMSRVETSDLVMGALFGFVLPGWATVHAVWAALVRRTDRTKSERHFVLAAMVLPLILLGYAILAGWVPWP